MLVEMHLALALLTAFVLCLVHTMDLPPKAERKIGFQMIQNNIELQVKKTRAKVPLQACRFLYCVLFPSLAFLLMFGFLSSRSDVEAWVWLGCVVWLRWRI